MEKSEKRIKGFGANLSSQYAIAKRWSIAKRWIGDSRTNMEEARLLCITCKPYLNGEHHMADSQSRPNCHYQYQYMASSIKMGVLSAIPPYLVPYHSPCLTIPRANCESYHPNIVNSICPWCNPLIPQKAPRVGCPCLCALSYIYVCSNYWM